MASVCENNDRENTQRRHQAVPLYDSDWASSFHRVSFDKVCEDQNYQIADGAQSDETGVFERI